MDVFNLHGDEWNRADARRFPLSRAAEPVGYWDEED